MVLGLFNYYLESSPKLRWVSYPKLLSKLLRIIIVLPYVFFCTLRTPFSMNPPICILPCSLLNPLFKRFFFVCIFHFEYILPYYMSTPSSTPLCVYFIIHSNYTYMTTPLCIQSFGHSLHCVYSYLYVPSSNSSLWCVYSIVNSLLYVHSITFLLRLMSTLSYVYFILRPLYRMFTPLYIQSTVCPPYCLSISSTPSCIYPMISIPSCIYSIMSTALSIHSIVYLLHHLSTPLSIHSIVYSLHPLSTSSCIHSTMYSSIIVSFHCVYLYRVSLYRVSLHRVSFHHVSFHRISLYYVSVYSRNKSQLCACRKVDCGKTYFFHSNYFKKASRAYQTFYSHLWKHQTAVNYWRQSGLRVVAFEKAIFPTQIFLDGRAESKNPTQINSQGTLTIWRNVQFIIQE